MCIYKLQFPNTKFMPPLDSHTHTTVGLMTLLYVYMQQLHLAVYFTTTNLL